MTESSEWTWQHKYVNWMEWWELWVLFTTKKLLMMDRSENVDETYLWFLCECQNLQMASFILSELQNQL